METSKFYAFNAFAYAYGQTIKETVKALKQETLKQWKQKKFNANEQVYNREGCPLARIANVSNVPTGMPIYDYENGILKTEDEITIHALRINLCEKQHPDAGLTLERGTFSLVRFGTNEVVKTSEDVNELKQYCKEMNLNL